MPKRGRPRRPRGPGNSNGPRTLTSKPVALASLKVWQPCLSHFGRTPETQNSRSTFVGLRKAFFLADANTGDKADSKNIEARISKSTLVNESRTLPKLYDVCLPRGGLPLGVSRVGGLSRGDCRVLVATEQGPLFGTSSKSKLLRGVSAMAQDRRQHAAAEKKRTPAAPGFSAARMVWRGFWLARLNSKEIKENHSSFRTPGRVARVVFLFVQYLPCAQGPSGHCDRVAKVMD